MTAQKMESQELIIHIDWSGPHSLEEVAKFNGPTDWGIYQIYGGHSVYGSGVLLYIGKTEAHEGGFAGRVPRSAGWSGVNQDGRRIEVYLGRLFGLETPDNETWERHIGLAESLLINAPAPARNLRWDLDPSNPEIFRVHVVNWRHYRDLLPEVSGARWSDRFEHVRFERHYSTNDFRLPSANAIS